MTTYGVTATGFVAKTFDTIKSDFETTELAAIDPALDTSPDQPLGQLNAIYARALAEVWELAQAVYNSADPDAAEGFSLVALGALTGSTPLPATPSLVTCTVNLNAGVTLPAGAMANVSGQPNNRWTLLGPDGAKVGDTPASVTNSGGSAANVTCTFQSVDNGPIAANSGTLTVITAPVSGWNSITNAADAALGSLGDDDTSFRQRREAELAAPGSGAVDAIRADLLGVTGVLQAFVLENTTFLTDANGLPPKSFECVIYDGATPAASDADIAATIWADKPSGIELFGTTSATATDSTGTSRTVAFSRAGVRNIYLAFTVTTDATKFPSNGITLIKAAVAAYAAANLTLGSPVIALALRSAALTACPGIVDVPSLALDFVTSPVATANLTVTARQIAVVDTSRITVNGV